MLTPSFIRIPPLIPRPILYPLLSIIYLVGARP